MMDEVVVEKKGKPSKVDVEALETELAAVKAERDSLKEEVEALKAVPPDALKSVEKFLKERVPILFDFDQFPVNKKQNMAIHREFIKETLVKLLSELNKLGDK